MRIINGKKFLQSQINKAVRIDNDGWDYYNGRNHQWYTLFYDPESGYTALKADNSGDCYGDYETRYFDCPESFANWCGQNDRDWSELLGEIDETDNDVMSFVNAIMDK